MNRTVLTLPHGRLLASSDQHGGCVDRDTALGDNNNLRKWYAAQDVGQ